MIDLPFESTGQSTPPDVVPVKTEIAMYRFALFLRITGERECRVKGSALADRMNK